MPSRITAIRGSSGTSFSDREDNMGGLYETKNDLLRTLTGGRQPVMRAS